MERDPEGGSDVGRDYERELGDEPPAAIRDTAPDFLAPIDASAPVSGHNPAPESTSSPADAPEQDWGSAKDLIYPAFRPVGTQGLAMESIDREVLSAHAQQSHAQPLIDVGPAELPVVYTINAGAYDIVVNGDLPLQTAIHANSYDLYASIRNDSPDTIGPSGLSSDGYAGMVFWDSDIWMFPAILATHPDIARAAVDYRFNTLQAAIHDAKANGYQGAFYPWTAADDGLTGADCYGTTTDANDTITADPNFSCSQ
jgi:hypothetical protein